MPSWKQIAEQYKRRARSARSAGGKVKIEPDGSVYVLPTSDSAEEYYFQEWQGDQLIEEIKTESSALLDYISLEDIILAKAQDW